MFCFEHKYYLFHIPSSTIVRVLKNHIKAPSAKVLDFLNLIEKKISYKKVIQKIEPNISSIALNIIQKCNLRCGYCYASDGTYGQSSIMSFETAKKTILFFEKKNPNLSIHFFGGEPLLNFSLIKQVILWSKKNKKKHSFILTSNGFLLDKKKLDFLNENKVSLKISYDGKKLQAKNRPVLQKEVQKKNMDLLLLKKLESFQQCLKNLENFHYRATLEFEDISSLPEIFDELINEKKSKMGYAFVFKDPKEIKNKSMFIKTI